MSYDIVSIAASLLAVFFVLVPHEFAHAFIAYKNGDATPKMYGRLTLNPIKHLDPIGLALCIFTGFGWAKPVPINPYNFRKYRKGLFTTAIAGVVTNYIIAFIAYPLYLALLIYAYPVLESQVIKLIISIFVNAFMLIFVFSLSVFVFNLLPLYPLDGFRIIESFTREINPIRRFLRNYGQYILIILVIESALCNVLVQYLGLEIANYFNILGFYVMYFARNIVGFPITALWNLIFGI